MQQDRGMRACNNNKMRNPSLHLFLLHALIPSLAAYTALIPSLAAYTALIPSLAAYTALIPCLAKYTLPSSPVLLNIHCPHPLSCCIYTALVLFLYILALSSLHPSTF